MGRFNLDFREKTSLNVLTNLIRTLAMALIGIFMTPYYLDSLGISAYAIIPLATTMASYIQIISDSLAYATVRFNILAFNTNDEAEINKTFSSSFYGLGRICLAILPIAIIVSLLSPVVFNISGNAAQDVQIMFALILISSILVTHSVTFNGVFYSTNDLYLLYLAKFAYSIAQIGVILLLFTLGDPSLVDIGVGYLVASIVVYVVQVYYTKRLYPCLKIRRRYFDWNLFKEMGNLGFWSILAKVGGMLYIELSMVLVNIYLGSEEQGGFALVATMISMVNTACYTVTGSIDPYLYKYYSEKDTEKLIQVAYTGTKFAAMMIAFPTLFLIVFSEEFLGAWLGSGYAYLSDLMVIGCAGNLAFCAVSAISCLPRVYLKMKAVTVATLLFGIVNAVLLSILLYDGLGSTLDAIAIWAFCTVALAVFNAVYAAMLSGAKWYKYLLNTITGYAIMVVCYYPLEFFRNLINIPGQWIPLIIAALSTFAVYLFIGYMLIFSSKEKSMVNTLLPGFIARHMPHWSLR